MFMLNGSVAFFGAAIRITIDHHSTTSPSFALLKVQILTAKDLAPAAIRSAKVDRVDNEDSGVAYYPLPGSLARATFISATGKTVTPHQWAVYDLIYTIPPGKVSTYKDVCAALGSGSPRSIGTALRINPFAPYIPCHRVIATTGFVGGYCGQWGPQSQDGGKMYNKKLALLQEEGVRFDVKGMLSDQGCIWTGPA
ncbi:hypothetical protein FRB96_003796 [Tulasnella sp. 330]|nr:hypothetical protein FRB96_003796 [Tulasnella sp. 330]